MEYNPYEKRQEFLQVYINFDKYLRSIGFIELPIGVNWGTYDSLINELQGVENWKHSIFNYSLTFMRDSREYKFLNIIDDGIDSELFSLDEFKTFITIEVKTKKEELIQKLENLNL